MQINWDSFKVHNQDSRGIRYKFEDLCRILFSNEFIKGNKQFRFLHSNPNNPGLETEPIFDEENKRWIGFQAKYFDDNVDYRQIRKSAEQTISHYTGQDGIVNIVYLFCNKTISTKAKGYKDVVNLFKNYNIEMCLITNDEILDLIRNKYSHLGFYFFGNHMITPEWFRTYTNHIFDELGDRYNRSFNIETDSLYELSLFVHDQDAADSLNNKKAILLNRLNELMPRVETTVGEYLLALRHEVEQLPDVNTYSLSDAIGWRGAVVCAVMDFQHALNGKREELSKEADNQLEAADKAKGKEREKAYNKYYETTRRINEIDAFLQLPDIITISNRERFLLDANVMAICGRAGTGKTHLLANKTKFLLDQNRAALLLPAGFYLSENTIQEQIMRNLNMDCSFDNLIDALEAIGERDNCIIPICIDALNETWVYQLWKVGLPFIVDKVEQAPMVKLIISYRTEYEPLLLSNSLINAIKNGCIVKTEHYGFEKNSGVAVKEFLNHYNIPFSPYEYFRSEMSNPLFLTLYCKTYNGEEVSLPELYERLIDKTNVALFRSLKLHEKGYTERDDTLRPLISQMAELIVLNERKVISQQRLLDLCFWKKYDLSPMPYIMQLVKEGLLHDHNFDGEKAYYFAYDQMNDYYCAKAIVNSHCSKEDIRENLKTVVLNIDHGKLNNYGNLDLFVNACALYAAKYREECIDIIGALTDEEDQWQVFKRYIYSFQWRDPKYINKQALLNFLRKYPCEPSDLWQMLIGNSIKVHHPLNADFLHEILSSYKLNRRDYLWTTYVNELPMDQENRLVQLVQMYNRGEKLDELNEKQIELLLTLLGWVLTSSNRWLRDHTSKAMIEIMKGHFELCQPILEKFTSINDPYVVQRLYGIVFGACCKTRNGDHQSIAEYVYNVIFNQEKVYPDILLRDYARLIIERFLWGNPNYTGVIDRAKVIPPYHSDPIPQIENQHYEEKDLSGAILSMVMSMRPEKMGWYGDFGRYVFQSAICNFEVDIRQMFNYAVHYILNDLGFSGDLFNEHDRNCASYDRSLTAKTERIGKKYQWITLYNILARVSDHSRMIDRWHYPQEEFVQYEGAWDPCVRDFDPTLNSNFMTCNDAPTYNQYEEHIAAGIDENKTADISNKKAKKTWLETKGAFLHKLKETLILTDEDGQLWVSLTKYCDTRRNLHVFEKLQVWSWMYAYFVSPEQAGTLTKCFEQGLSVITHDTASHHEGYSIFNREYPWSPSCCTFEEESAWVDAQIETEQIEKTLVPNLSSVEILIRKYCDQLDEDDGALFGLEDEKGEPENAIEDQYIEIEQRTKRDIGKILHATTRRIWEAQYDATVETAISWSVPCKELIESMNLRQTTADGFYYDSDGKIAAFDTSLTQGVDNVVVRKDILDSFLLEAGRKLVWLVDAEKEIHQEDHSVSDWSEWEGVFVYDNDKITGELRHRKTNSSR